MNAITHQIILVTNDTCINAQSVCELLGKITAAHAGTCVTLVLDNARYQKCAGVKALADSLNIELLYPPSYSPNLNLIERLWKFVKKSVLYCKYYEEFTSFKAAITDCLTRAPVERRAELDSLVAEPDGSPEEFVTMLTLRFQDFSKPRKESA